MENISPSEQLSVFNLLSYCFDVKTLFTRPSGSLLIKPGNMIEKLKEKLSQFSGTFHRFKITNCVYGLEIFPQIRVNALDRFAPSKKMCSRK